MSKFSVSPTGLKPVAGQTNFTKTSNQSMKNTQQGGTGGGAKQTKFTDLITSSNQSRNESERHRETIATLTAQVSELTKTCTDASNAHIEREKELMAEQDITADKLASMISLHTNLSTEHVTVLGQLQEARGREEEGQQSAAEASRRLQTQEEEAQRLRRRVAALETENEEMLASWDRLRLEGEAQTRVLDSLHTEAEELRAREQQHQAALETLQGERDGLVRERGAAAEERASLVTQLEAARGALTAMQHSLME